MAARELILIFTNIKRTEVPLHLGLEERGLVFDINDIEVRRLSPDFVFEVKAKVVVSSFFYLNHSFTPFFIFKGIFNTAVSLKQMAVTS